MNSEPIIEKGLALKVWIGLRAGEGNGGDSLLLAVRRLALPAAPWANRRCCRLFWKVFVMKLGNLAWPGGLGELEGASHRGEPDTEPDPASLSFFLRCFLNLFFLSSSVSTFSGFIPILEKKDFVSTRFLEKF